MKNNKNSILVVILILCFALKGKAQVKTCQDIKGSRNMASIYYSQENLRSDTFDILKYTINLDITDFAGKKIKGNTVVKFTSPAVSVVCMPRK